MTSQTPKPPSPGNKYCGEDPLGLAAEITKALRESARGDNRRMMPEGAITFFEGELRLIQQALRHLAEEGSHKERQP
jgi:hypothetical protein